MGQDFLDIQYRKFCIGLAGELTAPPYTIFAPDNRAFKKVNEYKY